MSRAAQQRVRRVHLALSTPGGQTREGIALYNLLVGMPFHLTTHNLSSVDSVGNVVFLAGEERFAVESATFMFHGVGFDVPQGTRLEERDARNKLDSIQADQSRMGQIITKRTAIEDNEVTKLFLTQQTANIDWAMQRRVIHDVRPFEIPNGSPVVSLVFNRKTGQ